MRWTRLILIALPLIWSCSDQRNGEGDFDEGPRLHVYPDADIPILEIGVPDVPDVEVDPCDSVESNSHSGWCACNPQCCKSQQWYCPPTPDNSIRTMTVLVDVCDENNNACIYGQDDGCPPPEILSQGECELAFECNPLAPADFIEWYDCELEDGTFGKQQIWCNKGQLFHGPCQPCSPEVCNGSDDDCDGVVDEDLGVTPCENECGSGNAVCVQGEEICFGPEPQEEICDYLDNDCDDLIDEGQTNECGSCGPVPEEICDGIDNNCDGAIDEDLIQECNTICGPGFETCSSGSWISCTADQPQEEVCDGFDNDCDGNIDEGLECLCSIDDLGAFFPCLEAPMVCGLGYKTCVCVDPSCEEIVTTDCQAMCAYLPEDPNEFCDPVIGIPLEQEDCNNYDDNCNGDIDEDLFSQCYTGPPETLNVGICSSGEFMCIEGVWGNTNGINQFQPGLCVGETTPSAEICNGADDDCDGVVDWGNEIPDTDVLFIVDWSGSMDQEINAVLSALNQFAINFEAEEAVQWGLIVGPRNLPGADEDRLFMISDISPFPDFLASFAGLGNDGMDTSSEMLLDAIYMSIDSISGNAPLDVSQSNWTGDVGESHPPKDQFDVSWRAGVDKIIIVFSDEEEQSYLDPEINTQTVIEAAVATPQLKIFTFSTNESYGWDEISDATSGSYFELSDNAISMYNSLVQILEGLCLPPEN